MVHQDVPESLRALVAERPDDREARFRLALAEVNLGNFARGDRPELAKAQYRLAIEQWEVLCRSENVRPRDLEIEAAEHLAAAPDAVYMAPREPHLSPSQAL